MSITLRRPDVAELSNVVRVLAEWQQDELPIQLHPGDLGWHWRFGAETTAAAVRTWSRNDTILAIGLLDGTELLRLAIAPAADSDDEVARQLLADLSSPERGVLPAGPVSIEARCGAAFRKLLLADGWVDDEPWTPLCRDLAASIEAIDLHIDVVGPAQTAVRTAVQRAAFAKSTFTDERWHSMAAGPAYREARCLVGYDEHGDAVAAATVWSAGPGRPGLLEPVGVHRDRRGRGHGTAITLAAAAALRELGSSSAIVCTPSSNIGAVATYRAAGFDEGAPACDLRRNR